MHTLIHTLNKKIDFNLAFEIKSHVILFPCNK